MLAAARKYKRVVQIGTQRRSTPHLIEARDTVIKRGQARQNRARRDLLLLPHARDRDSARRRAAGESRLRDVDRPRADAALQQTRPSAQLARLHGVRQRHRRRHVRPHARHDALDARPRLAARASAPPAAFSWTRRARRTSPTRRRATFEFPELQRRLDASLWGDAPDPKYPWAATFYGDKGTLKASVMGYDFISARQRRHADPQGRDVSSSSSTPRTRRRRISRSTSRPPSAGT